MIARQLPRLLAPAVVAASGVSAPVLASATPFASAAPCPDVQAVFARGTDDPPGVGPTGQALIDSLRPQIGAKSLDVYPVNYPATFDRRNAGEDGIRDAGAHAVSMAHDCPNTKMVLGGYSSGAAVVGFVTYAADANRFINHCPRRGMFVSAEKPTPSTRLKRAKAWAEGARVYPAMVRAAACHSRRKVAVPNDGRGILRHETM